MGWGELERLAPIFEDGWLRSGRDRERGPTLRYGNREGERRLEVRLLEGWIDAACVRNFKLGVEVDLAICWVNRAVQAFTRVHVDKVCINLNDILRSKAADWQAVVRVLCRVKRLAIERCGVDLVDDQVEECFPALHRVKSDLGGRPESFVASRKVEVDLVALNVGNNRGAFACFDSGEVQARHGYLSISYF